MGMKVLKDLREKQEALNKEIADAGKEALTEAFKDIFKNHPKLVAVKWHQYTPYFNDGDACTFRVGDFYCRFEDTAEDDGDYEDGFISTYGKEHDALNKDLSVIEGSQDILLSTFGDHQEMTVSRDGTIEQEEYSHD